MCIKDLQNQGFVTQIKGDPVGVIWLLAGKKKNQDLFILR